MGDDHESSTSLTRPRPWDNGAFKAEHTTHTSQPLLGARSPGTIFPKKASAKLCCDEIKAQVVHQQSNSYRDREPGSKCRSDVQFVVLAKRRGSEGMWKNILPDGHTTVGTGIACSVLVRTSVLLIISLGVPVIFVGKHTRENASASEMPGLRLGNLDR